MKAIAISFMLAMSQFGNSQIINQKHPSTNTMETQSIQVVHDFLTAVQQGNQAKLAAIIHPNIQWNQPGNNRFSGTKKSSGEVFQMVGGMFQSSDNSLALTEIKTLTANGNQVACLVHWKAVQPSGGILDVDNIDVYTVENGKIVQATVYSADIAQEDNFWLK